MTANGPDEAVQNANGYHTYLSGMCLKWVRDACWELPSLYASAKDAWNGARHKHPGDRTPPLGAPCFYKGGNYWHIVIARKSDIRSTDCTSRRDVSAVDIGWCERAWGYDYLGWTEDLNGVMLPLGDGEEDDMKPEDFEKIRDIVQEEIKKGWDWQQANDNSRAENLNLAGRAAEKALK